jgi:hypothetical protein
MCFSRFLFGRRRLVSCQAQWAQRKGWAVLFFGDGFLSAPSVSDSWGVSRSWGVLRRRSASFAPGERPAVAS